MEMSMDWGKSAKVVTAALAVWFLGGLLAALSATAAAAVENPKDCQICGMDRTANARSRMRIVFEDGTDAGTCSVHCAAAALRAGQGKAVKSLLVADYATLELLDARSAFWVVGGDVKGVMSPTAKWAFAEEASARQFVKEHGGALAPFAQVMQLADAEIAGGARNGHATHAGHDMGQMQMGGGSQLVFNPAFGDQVYHTHPAGMWMLSYQYMHMAMDGLRDGTSDVESDSVGYKRGSEYEYMMIPTAMTMDMHMLMAMYGVTDSWTVMLMPSYVQTKMDMIMDMGPMMGRSEYDPMSTDGLGDTEVRAAYKVNERLTASLGLSLPTGSIEETVASMRRTFRAPYDMQLGSGTYDLKPALTYNALSGDAKWNWGAQATYTWRTAENDNGWRYGDSLKLNGWLQRAFGPAAGWLRLAYGNTGSIRGEDREIAALQSWSPMPDADPDNYGGTRVDGAVGASCVLGPVSLGLEFGVPLYQDLNGLQMKADWFTTAGIQVMF